MTRVKGYYNGSSYTAEEPVAAQLNQPVIITLLEPPSARQRPTLAQLESLAGRGGACCPAGMDAQDYVNQLREERVS